MWDKSFHWRTFGDEGGYSLAALFFNQLSSVHLFDFYHFSHGRLFIVSFSV